MTRVIRSDAQAPRVVPRLVAEAHAQAAAIVEQAKLRAAELLSQAEVRAAERARAAEQEARTSAQREARQTLAHALSQLAQAERVLGARLESEVAALAQLAAQHLVAAQLQLHPDAIVSIVRPLLERLRRAHTLTMHVHPEDAEALRSALSTGDLNCGQPDALNIVARAEIARGGCVVVSDIGALDARIETRLSALEGALNRAVQRDGE